MKFVIEDIGDNKVSLYELNGKEYLAVPELVMSRIEAFSQYDIGGEIINGELKLFLEEYDKDEEDTDEEILDYMGVEEDD